MESNETDELKEGCLDRYLQLIKYKQDVQKK